MKDEDIEFIEENRKWRFVWTDIFEWYFILIGPLCFIFFSFIISYFSLKRETDFSFLLTTIPIFLFGCVTFYLIFKRIESEREFKIISFEGQDLKFENYFTNIGWRLSSKTDKIIIGRTKISWFSWGETITIILYDKELLFNSRPNGQPFTINRDKINYRKFCNAIA